MEEWDSTALRFGLLLWAMWLGLGLAQAQPQLQEKPVWTHHLEQGVVDSGEYPDRYRNLLNWNSTAGVTFIDDDQLVVYELVYRPGKLSARNPQVPEQSSFILRLTLFNLAHGGAKVVGEVPAKPEWTIVRKVLGGWVMRTGDSVDFTDESFHPMMQVPLLPRVNADIAVSGDGTTVLIDQWGADGGVYTVYDEPYSKQRLQWRSSGPAIGFTSISNDEVVRPTSKAVYTARFGDQLHEIFSACGALNCWQAHFVNNSDIAVSGKNSLTVLHSGSPVLKEALCKQCWVSTKMVSSLNGLYLAVPITQSSRVNWMDSATKAVAELIYVYDLKRYAKVFSLNVSPLPAHHYDLALSPSGKQLAILNDWDAAVYSVQP